MAAQYTLRKLPTFKGYTIDVQLGEFRKVIGLRNPSIQFVPFSSPKGMRLLKAMAAMRGRKKS